ncbi:MAG: hypothetical protein JWM47_540 [Acidimicrobiales bacterium]|nr:hypothetical protein [Acidimicrobiales bacterium]
MDSITAGRDHHLPAELLDGPHLADATDAPAVATLFQNSYQTPDHPARDPGFVRASIAAGDLWVVVRDGSRMVACLSTGHLPWTGAVELRFMAVAPGVRDQSLGSLIAVSAVDHLIATPGWTLVVAYSRGPAITRISEKAVDLRFVVTGHDGGRQWVHERHETHVVLLGLNPGHLPVQPATEAGSLSQRLLAHLAWPALSTEREIAPPDRFVVGPQATEWWTDDFAHLSPGELTLPDIGGSRHRALTEVARRVQVHDDRGGRYVSAVVPAAHERFLRDLRGLGFRPTAYLPTWYADVRVRHDCVLMVRPPGEADANGQEVHIDRWDQLLSQAVGVNHHACATGTFRPR